jgi:hypothetical protein
LDKDRLGRRGCGSGGNGGGGGGGGTSLGSEELLRVAVVFEVEARGWFSFSWVVLVVGTESSFGGDFAIISIVEAKRWKGGLGFGAC